jgi:hypothetical protein
MKLSAKNIVTSILAVAFLTACAGGRQKQAVAIEPAPGSKQPASDQNQNQNTNNEQQNPGGQQQPPPGQEQANPGGQDQGQGGAQPPADGVPPAGPLTQGSGQGQGQGSGTTNLSIEAVLEDGSGSGIPPSVTPGTTTVGTWDGKSFKGSGKWKVDPVN